MPYVPGFTNDIFISFAHIDNSREWVREFHDQLKDRLAQIDAKVTIWRDKKLRGTDIFSEEIFTHLQQSALLISIISPQAIKSGWCEDERQAFQRFAALNGGLRIGNQLRLIRVVKTPSEAQQHDLAGVLGYKFYKPQGEQGDFREFHPSSREFHEAIEDLAFDIKRLLSAFYQHLKTSPQRNTIYVATTTPDLKHRRDRIVQQLEDWNYAVVPGDSEPSCGLASFYAVTKAELMASMLSIHLVSNNPQLIEGARDAITEQYQLAQSLRKDRIVWLAPGCQLYADFDYALKTGLQTGDELVKKDHIENLKQTIRDKLDEKVTLPARTLKRETTVKLQWQPRRSESRQQDSANVPQPSISETGNPFPGLRSFEREQAHLFFGREEQIGELIERLSQYRFLPIIGVSGSGKSSLVRAGLIPALTGSFVETETSGWRIVVFRPGRNPMHELAATLCRAFAVSDFDTVLQTLRRSSVGLARIAQQHLGDGQQLLVVVDQFEELFRYPEETDPTGETDDDVAFVKLLLAAAGESKHPLPEFDDGPVYVVTTMRSEFLGECSRFRGLPEALNQSQYLIPRLTREQQREVIEGPIGMAGASIEPALVQQLLNDLGDNPDQLPALQHALMRTWEQSASARDQGQPITVMDYEAVGGMADALNRDADRVYQRLSSKLVIETITSRLFQRLIQPSAPNSETRSPTPLSELVAVTAAKEVDVKEVITAFEKRGFLTVSYDDDPIIDITHESLIRGWRRLSAWVEKERRSAAIYRRLAETLDLYTTGAASLLVDPELHVIMNWCDETNPNAAWAARYDSRFTEAMQFLERSRKEHEDALERVEQQRRTALKRARLTALVFGMLFFLTIGASTFAVIQWKSIRTERDRSTRLLYDSNVYFASSAVASGQVVLAQKRLDEVLDVGLKELRGFEWFYLWRSLHGEEATLSDKFDYVLSIAFSPDGKTLVLAGDRTVTLWDINTRTKVATFPQFHVSSKALLPDGKTLALANRDTVTLWDIATHKELATFASDFFFWSIAVSPDGKTLVLGDGDGVTLWDITTHTKIIRFSLDLSVVSSLTFSHDGKTLASVGSNNTVKLWDISARKELGTFFFPHYQATLVALSPDLKTLASADWDNTVTLWDITTGTVATLSGQTKSILSIAFSPDGKILASASEDHTIKLWDIATRKQLGTLYGHSGSVRLVAFSPDGKILASAGDDQTVKLWDTANRKEFAVLEGHSGPILSVTFSPDGKTIASGSTDHTVKLWNTTRKELATLSGYSDYIWSVAFSPDGKILAASGNKTVRLWNTAPVEELPALSGDFGYVLSVAFSPDGKTLASASNDHTIKLWDMATRKERATLSGHSGSVLSVAFSPDSKTLASGSSDSTVKLWDVVTGQELATLSDHSRPVLSVAFSPDGRTIASASEDQTVKLWDANTRKKLTTLSGHSGDVTSVAFSPDGATLVSGSYDNTVKLWDTATGKEVASLSGHSDFVRSVAFSPDGKILVSGGNDKTVKLWFAATDEEVDEGRRRGD